MRRPLFTLVAYAILLPHAAADEPAFNGRPLSGWLAMLKSDPVVRKRRAAVVALGEMAAGSREAATAGLPALGRAALVDADPAVRQQAAQVLGRQKADDAALVVADLAAAVRQEKVPAVRRELAVTLGRFGRLAKVAAGPLVDALADPDPGVQAAAADALGRIGPDAAGAGPELVKLVTSPIKPVRRAAVFAVGRVEPDDKPAAVAALVGVLSVKDDAELRRDAVTALGLLGTATPDAVGALAGLLTDPNVDARTAVIQTLGRFGPAAKSAGPDILKRLTTDSDAGVRVQAVRAIGQVSGVPTAELVTVLAERLRADPAAEVKVAAATELGGLGAVAVPALPALRAARADSRIQVREAAAAAVRRVETPAPPSAADGGER